MEEHSPPPPGQPGYGPPPGTPTSKGSGRSRHRLRNPLSIVLIAVIVIGLIAAGLLASELYVRHRAESVVTAATECVVQDNASVSFGATPLLLQLATGHYRNISIRTAGNRIGHARGMKADVSMTGMPAICARTMQSMDPREFGSRNARQTSAPAPTICLLRIATAARPYSRCWRGVVLRVLASGAESRDRNTASHSRDPRARRRRGLPSPGRGPLRPCRTSEGSCSCGMCRSNELDRSPSVINSVGTPGDTVGSMVRRSAQISRAPVIGYRSERDLGASRAMCSS
jgi:hypothetical protein